SEGADPPAPPAGTGRNPRTHEWQVERAAPIPHFVAPERLRRYRIASSQLPEDRGVREGGRVGPRRAADSLMVALCDLAEDDGDAPAVEDSVMPRPHAGPRLRTQPEEGHAHERRRGDVDPAPTVVVEKRRDARRPIVAVGAIELGEWQCRTAQ